MPNGEGGAAGTAGATNSLRLEKITSANFEAAIALMVRPDQEHAVAPVVKSLAEAYVSPETAWPRLILDGERPVGFLMAFLDIDFTGDGTDIRSGLWRLNIASGEQGRGYGRFAVESVAAEIRRRGGTRLTTSWATGDNGPEGFYLGLGFHPTGEMSGDQRVGELDLTTQLLPSGSALHAEQPPADRPPCG
ncbi:GNAT family N-acetyltransferase [Streptomyces hypolithicus]